MKFNYRLRPHILGRLGNCKQVCITLGFCVYLPSAFILLRLGQANLSKLICSALGFCVYLQLYRGVAQLASAPALGAGGRRFESFYPDRLPEFSECLHELYPLVHRRVLYVGVVQLSPEIIYRGEPVVIHKPDDVGVEFFYNF